MFHVISNPNITTTHSFSVQIAFLPVSYLDLFLKSRIQWNKKKTHAMVHSQQLADLFLNNIKRLPQTAST